MKEQGLGSGDGFSDGGVGLCELGVRWTVAGKSDTGGGVVCNWSIVVRWICHGGKLQQCLIV